NGRGLTRELWSRTDEAGTLLWRLSPADLTADAPLSSYPRIDRGFLPVESKRLVGSIGGRRPPAPARMPNPLPGEAPVAAQVGAPSLALNLMLRRGIHGTLRLRRLTGHVRWSAATRALVLLQGRLTQGDGVQGDAALAPLDVLVPSSAPLHATGVDAV